MKPQIYCKTTAKGEHSFYLIVDGREYYLFRQAYRRGVHTYFSNGIWLDEVYDISKAHRDDAIIRTLCKLPNHIRYVEQEYGIAILKRTLKKHEDIRATYNLSA